MAPIKHTTTLQCKHLSFGVRTNKGTVAEKWRCTTGVKFVINYDFRKITLYFTHLNMEYKAEFNFRDLEVHSLHPEIGEQMSLTMLLSHPCQFWINSAMMDASRVLDDYGGILSVIRQFTNTPWLRVVQIHRNQAPFGTNQTQLSRPVGSAPIYRVQSPDYLELGDWTVYRVVIDISDGANLKRFKQVIQRAKEYRLVPKTNIPRQVFKVVPQTSVGAVSQLQNTIEDFDMYYLLEYHLSQKIILPEDLTQEFLRLYQNLGTPDVARKVLRYLLKNDETRIWNPAEALKRLMRQRIFKSLSKGGKKIKKKKDVLSIRKAFVTPTSVVLELPYAEPTNRVLRKYRKHVDRFIRVQFVEEGKRIIQTSSRAYHDMTPVYNRILHAVVNGIQIGTDKYEFLAYSGSQLREHGCWFFASTPDVTAASIRKWMGDFSEEKVVAKYAARMCQCFSSTHPTVELVKEQIGKTADIKRNGYMFSDGVGLVSSSLAMMVATKMGLPGPGYPSAFQFRLGGAKGMLCVSPKVPGGALTLRPSQIKFRSTHKVLEINRVSKCSPMYLNRQIIQIMSTLGVTDSSFMCLLDEVLEAVNHIMRDPIRCSRFLREHLSEDDIGRDLADLVEAGFLDAGDPYLLDLLHVIRISKLKEIKKRAKILIPQGAHIFGVVDETGTLKEDEVFCQLPDKYRSLGSEGVVEGKVAVYRSPSLHPGDMRVMMAVDCASLRHLKNVIVFSSQGERDVPSMCSGGDLDGDTYSIIWDERFIPPTVDKPMDPDTVVPKKVENVQISDIQDFLVHHIINDNLGMIANAHMALADQSGQGVRDPRCMNLAKLHSRAVDFPKTGVMVPQTEILRPRSYPDFMEKHDKPKYPSEKILGKIYRAIQEKTIEEYEAGLHQETITYDPRLMVPGMETYIADARLLKLQYDQDLASLLYQFGLKTEAEFMSGSLIKWHRQDEFRNFFEFRNRVKQEMIRFRDEWRQSNFPSLRSQRGFQQRPAKPEQVRKDMAKAAAFYYVTYHPKEQRIATFDYPDFYKGRWYLSFAWIAQELLCKVVQESKDRQPIMGNLGEGIPEEEIQMCANTPSSSGSPFSSESSVSDESDGRYDEE